MAGSGGLVVVVVEDPGAIDVVVVVEDADGVDVVVSEALLEVSTAVGDAVGGTVEAVSGSLLQAPTISRVPDMAATYRCARRAARERTVRDIVESA